MVPLSATEAEAASLPKKRNGPSRSELQPGPSLLVGPEAGLTALPSHPNCAGRI